MSDQSMESVLDKILAPISSIKIKGRGAGLDNLGNTCYLSSILQMLLHNKTLQQVLLSPKCKSLLLHNKQHPDLMITIRFLQLFIAYWSENKGGIREPLIYFKKAMSNHFNNIFLAGVQQDQHECLSYLLETLHSTLSQRKRVKIVGTNHSFIDQHENKALNNMCEDGHSPPTLGSTNKKGYAFISPISRKFVGQTLERTECQHCKYVSHKFGTFRSLEVKIPQKGTGIHEMITIDDCLKYVTSITQLDKDNLFKCDKCGHKTQALKRTSLWKLPENLIVYIVRHLSTYHNGRLETMKDDRMVYIPMLLDVKPYTCNRMNKTTFKLESIGCHIGVLSGGHCTARIKQGDKWREYDDSHIRSIDEGYLQGREGHVLMYTVTTTPPDSGAATGGGGDNH